MLVLSSTSSLFYEVVEARSSLRVAYEYTVPRTS